MTVGGLNLQRYYRSHGGTILIILVLVGAGVVFELLMPWPLKLILDHVLKGQTLPDSVVWIALLPGNDAPSTLLFLIAVGWVLLFIGKQAIQVVQEYLYTGLGGQMTYTLGADLFERLQRLSLTFHSSASTGDLVRRVMTDSGCISDFILGVFLPALTSLITLAAMFTVMWFLDPALSIMAVMVAIPMGVLIRIYAPKMSARSYEQQKLEGQIMSHAEQTLSSLPVVQAFAREKYEDQHFKYLSQHTIKAYLLTISAQLQFNYSIGFTTAIGVSAIMGVGGLHVLDGTLTIGSLVVFLAYLASLYAPLETLAYLSSTYASASASARRISEIMGTNDGVWDTTDTQQFPALPVSKSGHIKLEGVKFGYVPNKPVLSEINLEVSPSETVALVGASGAGKSTLVALILRLYDPWSGCVMIDGMNIRDVRISDLRSRIAMVLQEPFLLPLTIAQNIAYGRPSASREQVVDAAISAGADDFIRELPQGYDTVLGERGATLSGGEQHRIAIARAFLMDAPILILDEPTAALDAQTESQLLNALERLTEGRTTIIIAHRLSTIRNADRIIVLEKGKIIEEGTHAALLALNSAYTRFHNLQFGRRVSVINGGKQ